MAPQSKDEADSIVGFHDESHKPVFNPRTYKQIHTPTIVQGGEGVEGTPPGVFVLLRRSEIILH